MLHYSKLKDKLPKLAKFVAAHYSVDCSDITTHHPLHHYKAFINDSVYKFSTYMYV